MNRANRGGESEMTSLWVRVLFWGLLFLTYAVPKGIGWFLTILAFGCYIEFTKRRMVKQALAKSQNNSAKTKGGIGKNSFL